MAAGKRSDAQAESTLIVNGHQSCVSGAKNFDTSRCGEVHDKAQAYATFHNVAVGAFLAGGVAAAGTALYFLWPTRPASSAVQQLRVIPAFGANDGGVIVSGSF